jgi:hypothetical protein
MVSTSPGLMMMIVTFPFSDTVTVQCKICDAGWSRSIVVTKKGKLNATQGTKKSREIQNDSP